MHARKGSSMTDETPGQEPTDEEVEYTPSEETKKASDRQYPNLGRGGDMTSDDESLARRPDQDLDEVDGDAESGGTPPGTATHGA
jgi:hypothetical protein